MNITMALDRDIAGKVRELAARQGTSLNGMIRDYLQNLVSREQAGDLFEKLVALMEEGKGSLKNKKWSRDDIHNR